MIGIKMVKMCCQLCHEELLDKQQRSMCRENVKSLKTKSSTKVQNTGQFDKFRHQTQLYFKGKRTVDPFHRFSFVVELKKSNHSKLNVRSQVDGCDENQGSICHQHFTRRFYMQRSQKYKKDCRLDCIFAILGSASVKAARKMLV